MCLISCVAGPPLVEAVLPIVNSSDGSTVVLRCRVQGSPKLTTRWLHNGTSLVTGGQAIGLRGMDGQRDL